MKSRKEIWKSIKWELDFLWAAREHVLMILMIITVIGLAIYGISPNPIKKRNNELLIFRNEKLIIVGTNEGHGFTEDKYHKPILIKIWLVQRVNDTTQFAELTSRGDFDDWKITEELWYSKGIGDTLYFDYILKNRFFTINNSTNEDLQRLGRR